MCFCIGKWCTLTRLLKVEDSLGSLTPSTQHITLVGEREVEQRLIIDDLRDLGHLAEVVKHMLHFACPARDCLNLTGKTVGMRENTQKNSIFIARLPF